MKVTHTEIPEVLVLEPKVFCDERGHFLETYNQRTLTLLGIDGPFVQDNQSFSVRNVLRGLHYQVKHVQGKLVRAVIGEIFDVAVDLRKTSPTFGRWVGERLSGENQKMLWIPPGFAHGFRVISDAYVLYKTTDYYAPECERVLLWSDPTLKIDWKLDSEPIVSAKDQAGVLFGGADFYE